MVVGYLCVGFGGPDYGHFVCFAFAELGDFGGLCRGLCELRIVWV